MVILPPSVVRRATLEPWHCWQPEAALAMPSTMSTWRPTVGECGLKGMREPSTVSARKLSKEARMLPAAAWWLLANSSFSAG